MNWGAWGEVELDGRRYGHKSREFALLAGLPQRVERRFVVAVGGPAPKAELVAQGWNLANPLEATESIEAYRAFIAGSYADLGVAKHAYVASRSGWFSDRSLCYLASGRPVLHQDTGFTDWLAPGQGVFPFRDADDVVAALAEIERDYARHAAAARALAEDRFEARKVLARMLADWGI
jgi:glycosyltransferase involved in cell wall biosynthesis